MDKYEKDVTPWKHWDILMQAVSLERFYLTRETVNDNYM